MLSMYEKFSSEIETQERIIQYIEAYCFEEEYNKTTYILEQPVRPIGEIYNDNIEFIDELRYKCKNAQDLISVKYEETEPLPEWIHSIDQREPLGELINYCIDLLDSDDTLDIAQIKSDIKSLDDETIFADEDIEKAIAIAPILRVQIKNEKLDYENELIERLFATLDMLDYRVNANIYRQSFISLFSIFDTYVFDFLKKYFILHIDELEIFFSSSDKLKLTFEEAIKFETIDELKNYLVEQKFNGKYIRHLLKLIKINKQQVFTNINFEKIMEMINRRNIHIHNQGIVDAQYIKEYNLDGLEVGDYAQISKQYFSDATAILKKFVQNIENEYK